MGYGNRRDQKIEGMSRGGPIKNQLLDVSRGVVITQINN